MKLVALLSLVALASVARAQAPERPLVGAIRWDAWHGDLSEVGLAVERSLSPDQYRFRLPWFTELREDGSVSIRCDREGVMAREVEFADRAGLDYWAFVTYDEDHPLSIPLHQYLAGDWQSPRFCSIVEWERFGGPEGYPGMVERLLGYFGDPRYVRVLGDRPLLYLLCHSHEPVEQAWGGYEGFSAVVQALRSGAREAGLGDPYVVVMWFDAGWADATRAAIGADALSCYAVPGGSAEGQPFETSQAQALAYWEAMAARAPMIPIVSLGWDPRPRVDHPVPWAPNVSPNHYETLSPVQCAEAFAEALTWVEAHAEACPAGAILCYAWNEHDEGGWLSPTLGDDGEPNTARIEAVAGALNQPTVEEGVR